MKLLFHIFRTLIVSLLVLLIMAPVALYALLPLPAVQEMAARTAREQLTLLLGTEVEIGSVELAPFNRVVVDSVTVLDPSGHPALRIGHLGAGISLVESIVNKKWAISYAEILDLELHLYRDSAGAPLNIEPIIERFKKKPSGAPTKFSLSVNTVVIRRSRVSYDVLSEPLPEQGVFSKSHIALADVCADLNCHTATESHIEASLRRLSATDRSGLTLSNVSFDTSIDTIGMRIEGFKAAMPHSRILLGDIHLPSPLGGKFNTDSISTPLSIEAGSYVSTVDLRPLAPVLREIDRKVELSLEANINSGRLDLSRFAVDSDGRELAVKTSGRVTDLFGHDPELTFDDLDISADVPQVAATLASTGNPAMVGLSEKLTPLLPLGDVGLAGRLLLRKDYADFDAVDKHRIIKVHRDYLVHYAVGSGYEVAFLKQLPVSRHVDTFLIEYRLATRSDSYHVDLKVFLLEQLLLLLLDLTQQASAYIADSGDEDVEHLAFGKEERIVDHVEGLRQALAVDYERDISLCRSLSAGNHVDTVAAYRIEELAGDTGAMLHVLPYYSDSSQITLSLDIVEHTVGQLNGEFPLKRLHRQVDIRIAYGDGGIVLTGRLRHEEDTHSPIGKGIEDA